jgi:hypothetical protein
MNDNPYESPKEKCESDIDCLDMPENSIPEEKVRATTLGCFLGGCLFPILLPIGLSIIAYISYLLGIPWEDRDGPDGPLAIIGWFCYWIILFPIGAIIGGFIELIIRRPRKPRQQKHSKPAIFPLDKKN